MDIVIPCATQNELDVDDAVMIVANNVRYYVEAANMPATAEALRLLRLSPKILTAGPRPPAPAAWWSPPWRWSRTASATAGPARRWTAA